MRKLTGTLIAGAMTLGCCLALGAFVSVAGAEAHSENFTDAWRMFWGATACIVSAVTLLAWSEQ